MSEEDDGIVVRLVHGDPRERPRSRSAHSASSVVLPYPAGAVIATTEAEREARRRSTKPVDARSRDATGTESFASVISNAGAVATRFGEPFRATRRIVPVPMVVPQTNQFPKAVPRKRNDDERSPTALQDIAGRAAGAGRREGPCGPNHPHRTTTAARHDARLRGGSGSCRLPRDEDGRDHRTFQRRPSNGLGLIRDADSVELKLTIHESARADAARALGVDPLDSQIRQVFFFDTPELALNAAGVVVRARRRQNGEGDTVVKLRPVVPNELAEELRASKSFNVEVDAMPGGSCARRRSRAWRTTRHP